MRNAIELWSWNPAREIFGFSPVLDRLVEGVLEPEHRKYRSAVVLTPACDVEETATHFLVSLDMPGISKTDIGIEVVDDQLVVTGERKWEKTDNQGSRHVSERSFGKFHRAFSLGAAVEKDKIEAVYSDGVLRIAVPKAEAATPRKIQVQSEDKTGFFASRDQKEESAKKLN